MKTALLLLVVAVIVKTKDYSQNGANWGTGQCKTVRFVIL